MPSAHLSPSELRNLIDQDPRVRVVDVRTGGEFEAGHIDGSYNVPIEALGEHRRDLVEVGDPVVLVCQSGARAARVEAALLDAGMDNVRVLSGGMNAWQQEGHAVRTLTARWPMDRQVRLVAGSIVIAAIAASVVLPKAKWVAAAVGGGLAIAAATNTCAMGAVLSKLPYNQPTETDVLVHVARLRADSRAREAAA